MARNGPRIAATGLSSPPGLYDHQRFYDVRDARDVTIGAVKKELGIDPSVLLTVGGAALVMHQLSRRAADGDQALPAPTPSPAPRKAPPSRTAPRQAASPARKAAAKTARKTSAPRRSSSR